MNFQDRLIKWHFQWQLRGGSATCRECHAKQSENDKSLPFQHLSDCRSGREAISPWDELELVCHGYSLPRES